MIWFHVFTCSPIVNIISDGRLTCSWVDDADMWMLIERIVSLVSETIWLFACVLTLAYASDQDLPARNKSSHGWSFGLPYRSKDLY